MELSIWLVLTEHDAIFLRSCHKKVTVIIFLGQPIRISASGTNLTNEKLSCWDHGTAFTGSHTKPPIMPYFSEFHSVAIYIFLGAHLAIVTVFLSHRLLISPDLFLSTLCTVLRKVLGAIV